jgi:hypothetical protein
LGYNDGIEQAGRAARLTEILFDTENGNHPMPIVARDPEE